MVLAGRGHLQVQDWRHAGPGGLSQLTESYTSRVWSFGFKTHGEGFLGRPTVALGCALPHQPQEALSGSPIILDL